jgi:plastocyanin
MRLLLSIITSCLWLIASSANAENEISIDILSESGLTLSDVVLSLKAKPSNKKKPLPEASQTAVMNQLNQQFVPHILAVKQGTTVSFPNTDSVKHHVYSFSPARTFEISLQEQLDAKPIKFDEAGVVEIEGLDVYE